MKKLGLALGSGGSRGLAHVGFLKALEENGIKPSFISGCSMGAVVGACYANGMSPDVMLKTAQFLKKKDLLDISMSPITSGAILRSEKVTKIFEKLYQGKNIEDLSIPYACIGADIISGNKVVFNQGSVATAVRASSAIPLVFKPVEYDDMIIADGGVLCRLPVQECRDLGADVVICMDVLGPLREMGDIKNIFSYFLRLIDVYDNRITSLLKEREAADLTLTPDMGEVSQYKVDNVTYCYQKGYDCAMKKMDEINALLK